jgi:hypothetical protein
MSLTNITEIALQLDSDLKKLELLSNEVTLSLSSLQQLDVKNLDESISSSLSVSLLLSSIGADAFNQVLTFEELHSNASPTFLIPQAN